MTTIVPPKSIRESLEASTQEYVKQLSNSEEGLAYLESRGLSKQVVASFRIGYVGDPLPGDDWFKGCISIPYLTPAGVVGMKYRSVDGSNPKYRKRSGEPNLLYNVSVLTTARKVVLTEGELDVVAATEAGLQAVGVPGAKSWKKPWNRIFRNRQVTVLCDGDQAGRELGEKLSNEIYGCRVVELPDGEDVNSCLVKYGPGWLREKVLG